MWNSYFVVFFLYSFVICISFAIFFCLHTTTIISTFLSQTQKWDIFKQHSVIINILTFVFLLTISRLVLNFFDNLFYKTPTTKNSKKYKNKMEYKSWLKIYKQNRKTKFFVWKSIMFDDEKKRDLVVTVQKRVLKKKGGRPLWYQHMIPPPARPCHRHGCCLRLFLHRKSLSDIIFY